MGERVSIDCRGFGDAMMKCLSQMPSTLRIDPAPTDLPSSSIVANQSWLVLVIAYSLEVRSRMVE